MIYEKFAFKKWMVLISFALFFFLISFLLFLKSDVFKEEKISSDILEQKNYWINQINTKGDEQAYIEFKGKYSHKYPQDIHYIAHIFGTSLFEIEGVGGIRICDEDFAYGCYHGVIVSALEKNGLDKVNLLNEECVKRGGNFETGCRHGIGHGLLEFLGDSKLNEALKICSVLQSPTQLGCTQGVFMEFNRPGAMSANQFLGLRKLENETQLFYPCDSVDRAFQISCYYEQSQWWLGVYKDYKKVGWLCESLNGIEIRRSCFLGIGVNAAQATGYSVAETIRACLLLPNKKSQRDCRLGAGWVFKVNPKYNYLSRKLCDGLNELEKRSCFENSIAPNEINLADN